MKVAGIDLSTFAVDVVKVPLDAGAPEWSHYPLTGVDAWERTRSVAQALPGPSSAYWDDVCAIGVEEPRGKSAGVIYRVQGAVLARLPVATLVHPLVPSEWRRIVGLKGNASKEDVRVHALAEIREFAVGNWRAASYDATDAFCIAVATRSLISQEQAA
ncbi:MAG: hypothetical protein H0U59_09585 [Gemmatimonadaceae bacterium]|nr:hypothetical protein [Gemmatimonadaceae bacterium]